MAPARRQFLKQSLAIGASVFGVRTVGRSAETSSLPAREFERYQQRRRWDLWRLLGQLPWEHRPGPPKLIKTEKGEGYTLERLELDLNGIEPVPAILLIPDRRQPRAPGLIYCHWHGYDQGKEQLLEGVKPQPAYAPVCVEKGLVTLAIDAWCFGERKHEKDGVKGEQNAFKEMLWRGRVMWGMMTFDTLRALDYLAGRPEVDATRIGVLGMSMGSTQAWWLAALEPRIRCCMDVCCLTDFDALIQTHALSEHGIYYFVPSLLPTFNTSTINELIVPRPRLSVNGRFDPLTPPAGVERIRDYLAPLYKKYGKAEDLRIELFDCKHQELPEMRQLILQWMERYLVQRSS